ncbi:MAG: tetratricopeptide repeat protein [Candidatus Omnitrophota bacterium]
MRNKILALFTGLLLITPLIVLPLTIDYYNPPKELFIQVAIALIVVLWIRMGLRENKFEVLRTRFYFLFVGYLIIAGASLVNARSSYLGLRDFSLLLCYGAAFFVTVNLVRRRDAYAVGLAIFAAASLAAVYALAQYWGFDPVKYPEAVFPDWRFRLYSTFGNPDFIAGYLVTVFPVGLSLYLGTERILKKTFYLIFLTVLYAALLVTFSMGALIAFALSFAVMTVICIVEKASLQNLISSEAPLRYVARSLAALALVMAAVTCFFFMPNKYHPQSLATQARSSVTWRHGLENRMVLYRCAYRMSKDHPFLGVGIGNFKICFPQYRADLLGARGRGGDPAVLDKEKDRNILCEYIQACTETGYIGLAVFLFIIFVILKTGLVLYGKCLDHRKKIFLLGLTIGLLAFLIHAVTSFPFHIVENALLFWVLTGLIFSQLPEERRYSIPVLAGNFEKRLLALAVTAAAILALVWPVRLYLGDVFLKRMVDLDKRGLFDLAATEARTALYFDQNSSASIYLSNYALVHQDYETAEIYLKKAIENDDQINYHVALGRIYYQQKLPKDAVNEYTKALRLNPYYTELRLALAEIYVESKMYTEAEAECQLLLINNTTDAALTEKLKNIMQKIFRERFMATYGVAAKETPPPKPEETEKTLKDQLPLSSHATLHPKKPL